MKQIGEKGRIIALLEILKEHTDANKGITMKQLQELLQQRLRLGHTPDRKSIGKDILALQDAGYDIAPNRKGNDYYYHLMSREFSPFELHLLADSVASSKFLSEKTANELIRKLKQFTNIDERESISRHIILTERVNDNDRIHTTLQTIQRAIAEDNQITFRYTYYDENKVKQRRKKQYKVSPWATIYADNNYYLLGYDGQKLRHYRIDRMVVISAVLDSVREGQDDFKKVRLQDYQKKVFSMYGGKVESVTLRFTNDMMNVAVDRFGKGIVPSRVDDNHFKITVPVAVSPQFYGWVFGLGTKVKVIEPQNVVDGWKEYMGKIYGMY